MKHYCTLIIFFTLMIGIPPIIPADQLRITTVETVACQKFEVFERVHQLNVAKEYVAAVKAIPHPPECVDLFEGQIVEGPLEEKTEKYMSINYTKVLIGERTYWVMSSHLGR